MNHSDYLRYEDLVSLAFLTMLVFAMGMLILLMAIAVIRG